MIEHGLDDYTVMSISGHSSTRMLARYTHPTEERKIGALSLSPMGTGHIQILTRASRIKRPRN